MTLTPQEVASKVFGPTRMRRGYDENEVDAFLDVVEAELTRLTSENQRLRSELESGGRSSASIEAIAAGPLAAYLPAARSAGAPTTGITAPGELRQPTAVASEIAPAPAEELPVEQRVARILVLAQQTADAAVLEAQTDADRLRGQSRMEAERLVADARARAAAEIGALERMKSSMESHLHQLETFEHEYRDRLRAYLTVQLTELDHLPTAPAVEGTKANVLDVSDSASARQESQQAPTEEPLAGSAHTVEIPSLSLSDPPGLEQIWSPDSGETPEAEASSGGLRGEGAYSKSSFDTGGQGLAVGGYGAAT